MMPTLVFLLASRRLDIELIPPPVGGDRALCFARLADGESVVHGVKQSRRFFFDGRYALEVFHEGDGAGRGVYKKYGAQWCELSLGGGASDEQYLVGLGVPRPVAQRLLTAPDPASKRHR